MLRHFNMLTKVMLQIALQFFSQLWDIAFVNMYQSFDLTQLEPLSWNSAVFCGRPFDLISIISLTRANIQKSLCNFVSPGTRIIHTKFHQNQSLAGREETTEVKVEGRQTDWQAHSSPSKPASALLTLGHSGAKNVNTAS